MHRFKLILIVLVATFVCACATPTPRIKETKSGWPETEINTANKRYIVSNIIRRNVETGWTLEQESDSTLLFTKVNDSGSMNAVLVQAMIGNAYSTPPKAEARYIVMEHAGVTKVIVNVGISTQMSGGQINRMNMDNANGVLNMFQAQLDRVKAEVERELAGK
jgi:hypothetical protein